MDIKYFKEMEHIFKYLYIDLIDVGIIKADESWNHYNVKASFNKLYFITKEGFTLINKETEEIIVLKKDSVYLIPCNCKYDFICDNYGEKIFLHFNINLPNGFDVFYNCNKCLEKKLGKEYLNKLMNILEKSGVIEGILLKEYIYNIITTIIIENSHLLMNNFNSYSKISNEVFRIVRNNLSSKLTINEIADILKVSTDKVYGSMKNDLGISPKRYINTMVLQRAKKLLISSNKSIKEIADELEFNDQYYFCNFFKKYESISPSQYRKELLKKIHRKNTVDKTFYI